jgi:hypothetical protein
MLIIVLVIYLRVLHDLYALFTSLIMDAIMMNVLVINAQRIAAIMDECNCHECQAK